MPIVQIDLIEGRTVEQKRELVKRVTEAISETAACPTSAVTIIMRDMPKENLGQGGKLRADQQKRCERKERPFLQERAFPLYLYICKENMGNECKYTLASS